MGGTPCKCDRVLDKQWTWLEISWLLFSPFGISHLQQQRIIFIKMLYIPHIIGCLESVEWNGGMDYWNGILEWTGTKFFHLHIIKSL